VKLSDQEQQHQLQLLEKRHRKELIEVDAEIQAARHESEKAVLAHELALARMRQDAEVVHQIEEIEQQADNRYQVLLGEFDELKETLGKLADLPDNILAQLANTDERESNVAADRLVSPEYEISVSSLGAMGFRVDRQVLVDLLKERVAANPREVVIRKRELRSRDIGTTRVNVLHKDESLQFEFSTKRDGYATVLNLGTSGTIYIHVPNPLVSQEKSLVEKGQSYEIPGLELLPWELAGDYCENDTTGWEHIAVLVSDKPIVGTDILDRGTLESPFTRLTREELCAIGDLFSIMPPETCSVGLLSMLVE